MNSTRELGSLRPFEWNRRVRRARGEFRFARLAESLRGLCEFPKDSQRGPPYFVRDKLLASV